MKSLQNIYQIWNEQQIKLDTETQKVLKVLRV